MNLRQAAEKRRMTFGPPILYPISYPMHRHLTLLVLLLLCTCPSSIDAQTGDYEGQISAIERMIAGSRFALARAQSEALIEEGRQQQLPNVEAYGNYLLGRALLLDPVADHPTRVAGVRALRLASSRFTDAGMTATVDSIAAALQAIAGTEGPNQRELPTVREVRRKSQLDAKISAEELDESALGAIVALQTREIEALNDSQLRQLVRIQQQDMQLDSFAFQVISDSLLLMRQEMLLEEQRSLTREERQRRNFFIALALGVLVALGSLYLRFRSGRRYQGLLRQKNAVINEQQERSDKLLLNILPLAVARELKESGKATARRFESCSVLFSDFVGFSRIAATHEPEVLVHLLDVTFRAFDEIIERHGLEKIKTIGDAYMCVGGVPIADPDHAEKAVRAALELQRYLAGQQPFEARIGIHSGPVVAGVVGQKKFAYDIWGDTVNQAARLEAAGQPGQVTVSRATCQLLGGEFECVHDGTFSAKNIGEMDRYIVLDSRLTKKPS